MVSKLLLLSILIFQGYHLPERSSSRFVISKACSLKVEGSTNVNKFNCEISSFFSPDTLTISSRTDSEAINFNGSIKLNVRQFDCHNPIMTGDLRKTLKTKEYPYMIITFISLSKHPVSSPKTYSLSGQVYIELAGVKRKYNVAYTVSPAGRNNLLLKGVREINFSDFNIIPPRKIGGMIQTNDKLLAEFNLALQPLNERI